MNGPPTYASPVYQRSYFNLFEMDFKRDTLLVSRWEICCPLDIPLVNNAPACAPCEEEGDRIVFSVFFFTTAIWWVLKKIDYPDDAASG